MQVTLQDAYREGREAARAAGPVADLPDTYGVGSDAPPAVRRAFTRGWSDERREMLADVIREHGKRDAAPTVVDPYRAPHAGVRPDYMADGVPEHPDAPDPYESVRSTVKTGRGSKGQTTRKVTRHGTDWTVVGSWQPVGRRTRDERVPSDQRLVAAWHAARQCEHGRGGWTSRDLVKIADAFIGGDVPRLLGGDLVSWEEVIRAGDGTVDAYSVAWHNPGLSGGRDLCAPDDDASRARVALLDELARPVTARTVLVRRPTPRLRIVARRRKGETDVRTFIGSSVPDVTIHHALWSPRDDSSAFIGHRRIVRPATVRRNGKRAARTIGAAAIAARADVTRAVSALNRGDRLTFETGHGTRGTITRAADGRYAWRITRGPNGRSRTVDHAATTLADALDL